MQLERGIAISHYKTLGIKLSYKCRASRETTKHITNATITSGFLRDTNLSWLCTTSCRQHVLGQYDLGHWFYGKQYCLNLCRFFFTQCCCLVYINIMTCPTWNMKMAAMATPSFAVSPSAPTQCNCGVLMVCYGCWGTIEDPLQVCIIVVLVGFLSVVHWQAQYSDL